MKKIYIALILLVVFVPGIFIPVYAASDPLTVNLLNAVEFLCRTTNTVSIVPSFQIFDAQEAVITWDTSIPYNCANFVLGMYSSSAIIDVSFNGTLGELIGHNDTYYQFKFTAGDDIQVGQVNCKLTVRFEQDYQHNVNLVSFWGYQSNYIDVETVSYELMRQYQVRDHEMLQFDTILDQDVSLPFSHEYHQLSWSGTPERLYYGVSYVNIDPEALGVQYLDSLQIQFSFTGTDYHSARLIDKDTGETVTVLDYSYNHSTGYPFETMDGYSDYEVNLYHTLMNIDLSGEDLDGCYIQVVFAQEALVWAAVTENQEGFFVRCDWARVILPAEDLPWYTVFFKWLKDSFGELFGWLQIIEGVIVEGFDNLVSKLGVFFQDIGDRIDEWGQQILDVLSPDTEDLDQAIDGMESAGDGLNEDNAFLETVPRAEIEDFEVDISTFVDAAVVAQNSNFFSILLNFPFSKLIMSLSMIFCTASFVIFGKR